METYTSSCEIFHLRTKTWAKCNDLPYPLAFATVISTPKGAWILGGKTSPFERASVQTNSNIVMKRGCGCLASGPPENFDRQPVTETACVANNRVPLPADPRRTLTGSR